MKYKKMLLVTLIFLVVISIIAIVRSKKLVTGNTLANSDTPQIAFIANNDLFLYDDASSRFIQLTQTQAVQCAAWSPDGRYLAFGYHAAKAGKEAADRVYRLDVTTGKLLSLTPDDGLGCQWLNWSPDGKTIACSTGYSEEGQIFLIQADGRGLQALTSGMMPSWSADGKRLIFIQIRETPTTNYDPAIAIIDIQTGTVSTLLDTDGYEAFPQWSPDGKWVAYYSSDTVPWGFAAKDQSPNLSLYVWDGESATFVSGEINERAFIHNVQPVWSANAPVLRSDNCEYDFTTGVSSCPGSPTAYATIFSPDGKHVLQFDQHPANVMCIIPPEANCVDFPQDWAEPTADMVIGWRPR